jgi:hypothetical protein
MNEWEMNVSVMGKKRIRILGRFVEGNKLFHDELLGLMAARSAATMRG